MGKILIIVGIVLILIGVLLVFKIPIPFGNLPGDISIKRDNFQIYFPFATSLLLSILISLLLYFFSK